MIKQEHIDGRVKKALNDKTKSLKKLNPTTDKNFFTGTALDVSSVNPMDQEFYRMPFAKVSIAVPDVKKDTDGNTTIVHQPISISSYMNDQGDNKILGVTDKENNKPLAFIQGYNESETNRFRGHTGIKSIKQTQQNFYTSQYTIDWECPDPVHFEQVFEPAFLKLGGAVTLEFGYGNALTDIKIPPITIEDMKRYLNDQKLTTQVDNEATKEDTTDKRPETIRERNMRAPGTYFCDIGIIDNFDYKLTEGGGYTGTIRIVSMGTSPLLETNKPGDESENSNDLRRSLDSLTKFDKKSRELFGSTILNDEQKEEVFKNIIQSSSDIKTLLEAGVTFGAVIKNLDKVLEKYLNDKKISIEEYSIPSYYTDKGVGSANDATILGVKQSYGLGNEAPILKQRFKDGILYFDFEVGTSFGAVRALLPDWMRFFNPGTEEMSSFNDEYEANEKLRKRYYMSWGFFEDIILGSFFELKAGMTDDSEGKYIQRIRSVDKFKSPNKCIKSDFLYSLGLDKVMLPGKAHPLLKDPLKKLTEEEQGLVRSIYSAKQLRSLEVIRTIYNLFDEKYRAWTGLSKLKFNENQGNIRDMVFPIELYKKHFENASSLRQSLTNFWADVSGMYGGYWRFVVGQSQDDSVSIGVSDMRLSPKDPVTPTPKSDLEEAKRDAEIAKIDGCYVFELYSEDSIVKSFDLSLDLSSEMAVQARYGRYKPAGGTSDIKSLSDVSIEAWNLLSESKTPKQIEDQKGLLEDYTKLKELQPELIKNLSYPTDNGKSRAYERSDNYKSTTIRERNENGFDFNSIPEINEDTTQELEKINNDYSSLYKGIGIYDKNGNMSSYFKQTMLYLLNTAKIKGSGSLITTHPIVIPVSITMTLDGIGGLKVGDIFKVDYLPQQYRKHTYFVVQKVEHSITSAGWTTEVGAYMQMVPQSYFAEPENKIPTAQEADLQKLFEYDNVDFNDIIVGLGDTGKTTLADKLKGIQEQIAKIDDQMNYLKNVTQLDRDRQNVGHKLKQFQEGHVMNLNSYVKKLVQQRLEIQKYFSIESFKPTFDEVNENVDNAIIKSNEFKNPYIIKYNLFKKDKATQAGGGGGGGAG